MTTDFTDDVGPGAEPWEEAVRHALGELPTVEPPPDYFQKLVDHQRPAYAGRLVLGGAVAALVTALGVSFSSDRSAELAGLLDIPIDGSTESGEQLLIVLGADADSRIVDGPGPDLADVVPDRVNGWARHDFMVEAGVVVVWYGEVKVRIADRTRHPEAGFDRDLRPDQGEPAGEAWVFDRGANRFTFWGEADEVEKVAAGLGHHIDDAGSVSERLEATLTESLELFGFPAGS